MITNKTNPTLTEKCTLIAENTVKNKLDDYTTTEEQNEYFCAEFAVSSNENRNSVSNGIKAEKGLIIYSMEYAEQEKVIYNGIKYSIYRTYPRTDGYTELYLTKRMGNG